LPMATEPSASEQSRPGKISCHIWVSYKIVVTVIIFKLDEIKRLNVILRALDIRGFYN